MKRDWSILLLGTFAVFAVSWMAADFVFRTTGVHTWANAHFALKGIQEALYDYQQATGDLPPIQQLESEIRNVWEQGFNEISGDYDGRLEIVFMLTEDRRLRLWNSPPRVVLRSKTLGYGFYLEGEDGTSATQGEDPDDINSWDFGSTSYYYDRLRHRRWIRNGLWAIAPTTLVFVVGWVSFIRKQKEAQQAAPSNH